MSSLLQPEHQACQAAPNHHILGRPRRGRHLLDVRDMLEIGAEAARVAPADRRGVAHIIRLLQLC